MVENDSKMDELIQRLIGLIRSEEGILEEFLECLSLQKEFIVQNNITEFERTVEQEERLIESIRSLEQGRIDVIESIASSAGSPADQLTLTRIIEMNLGETSAELKALKHTLSGLVVQVKRANRVNQYLMKRSLSFIQKNIDWFIDDGNMNVFYLPNGKRRNGGVSRILVDKTL